MSRSDSENVSARFNSRVATLKKSLQENELALKEKIAEVAVLTQECSEISTQFNACCNQITLLRANIKDSKRSVRAQRYHDKMNPGSESTTQQSLQVAQQQSITEAVSKLELEKIMLRDNKLPINNSIIATKNTEISALKVIISELQKKLQETEKEARMFSHAVSIWNNTPAVITRSSDHPAPRFT